MDSVSIKSLVRGIIMLFPLVEYNRVREDGGPQGSISASYVNTAYNGIVGNPWRITSVTNSSYSDYASRITREMHDVVTPEFKRLRNEGRIINSPMEQETVTIVPSIVPYHRRLINRYGTSPNYYYVGYDHSGTTRLGGSDALYQYPSQPSINVQNLINSAIQDMWAKVSVKQNDTIASLGEMRETIASLISIFRRVIDIYRDMKKFRLGSIYRKNLSPKALSEMYMFYRYALRPLVFEAQSYVDVLCNKTILRRQTFRSYRVGEVAPVITNNVTLYDSVGNRKLTGMTEARRSVEIRGGVLCTLDITNNLGRWGITEPFEGVWELVPFSFIIDWFFNIGKYIAMWTPNFGIQTLASWIVVTDITTLTSTVESGINYASGNYTSLLEANGSYYKSIIQKWRMPDPTRPTIPVWQVRLDWLKSLDIGVILKQLIAAKR